MSLMPVVDALRANVPIPSGLVRDDSGSEPMQYAADRLYVWDEPEVFVEDCTGPIDRSEFVVMIAVTVASTETSAIEPSRDTSLALDAAADAIASWVRANRFYNPTEPPLWEDLQATIQPGGLRGFDYRGKRLRLAGYRLITS